MQSMLAILQSVECTADNRDVRGCICVNNFNSNAMVCGCNTREWNGIIIIVIWRNIFFLNCWQLEKDDRGQVELVKTIE